MPASPPPRRRFQIHLSTAIVLMVTAGGFMWANTFIWLKITESIYNKNNVIDKTVEHWIRGFPLPTLYSDADVALFEGLSQTAHIIGPFDRRIAIPINVCFAIATLWFIWFILESLIRRRAARKDF